MTPSHALAFRVAAVLLAALLSLTGSGASIAHGIAHVREHRAADHRGAADHHGARGLEEHSAREHGDGHHDGGHHVDHDARHVAHEPLGPAVDATPGAPTAGAPDAPATHPHARLDALAVTRLAIAAFLPAVPVRVAAPPVIAATVEPPPATTPLRLAEPPTGPPPPSRAPPLG